MALPAIHEAQQGSPDQRSQCDVEHAAGIEEIAGHGGGDGGSGAFAGGAPGRFYGTELDGRLQYRLFDHFIADLEGAVLFPGNVFQDANGDAVRSVLVQARATFFL